MKLTNYLPFTYSWIIRHHLGDQKNILDVGCGDGDIMKLVNFDKKYSVCGVDLYEPYLKKAKNNSFYKKLIKEDIRNLKFGKNSFDAVLSSQVVEHLTKKESSRLIRKMEEIAKSEVLVCTTNGFFPFEPIDEKDDNPLQVHKCGWEVDELRRIGYKVYGNGSGFIYKPGGLAHRYKKLRQLFFLVSYILSPVNYFFPKFSTYIVAVKEFKNVQKDS